MAEEERVKKNYDVTVIGAGPAGLSFACSLADTGLSILLIEKQAQETIAKPSYDGREIALTHFSQKVMQKLEMWDIIPESKRSLIKDAKVLNGDSDYALHFSHTEAGKDNLGFMISNQDIRQAAYDATQKFSNIHFITEREVTGIYTDAYKAELALDDGQKIETRLIVAADSRFSKTRDMMNIETSKLDFKRTCIVTTMSITGDHEQTACEYFFYGNTLAVLPLNGNNVSVVITIDTDRADEILKISPEEFSKKMMEQTEHKFGEMKLNNKLFPYPLVSTLAKEFYAERFALVGDAAVGMHPVTAHGFNLGLKGGYTLANEIKEAMTLGQDVGASYALKKYSDKHRAVCVPMYMGTNALVKLYTSEKKTVRLARAALLRIGGRFKPAKDLIMKQLTEADKAASL